MFNVFVLFLFFSDCVLQSSCAALASAFRGVAGHFTTLKGLLDMFGLRQLIVSLLAGAALAAALANLSFAYATPLEEWLIVPGKSIGPVRIGIGMDDARAIMARYGSVKARIGTEGRGTYYCTDPDPNGLCISDVMVYGKAGPVKQTAGRVAWVNTGDERFHTKEGFRIWTPSSKLLRVYGKPTRDEPHPLFPDFYYVLEWHALGIGILTANAANAPPRDGLVTTIGVFVPIR